MHHDGLPDPPTVDVLGYGIAVTDLEGAARWTLAAARREEPRLVVTLNPEIVVRAHTDPLLRAVLTRADLTVADGVGLLWAARRSGHRLPGRVPGVDLAARVMERGGAALSVYFLGGRPGVAERAAAAAAERWDVRVAGHHHGYFGADADEEVVDRIGSTRPHLLLAGLGERQETFLDAYRGRLRARVLMGVGGTLDVLAGEAKRTPEWTRRLNLEWAWRVGLDRRRWHRFPRLLKFVALVRGRSGIRPPGRP